MAKIDFCKTNRQLFFDKLEAETQDVLIIGGGINGAVSLAACAKAGLKSALCEKNDFGSMTSQNSSNLIWGGIKYLENFEFPLVLKLCGSRNRLMRNFPSNVKEIRFLTLHEKTFRFPLWFLYLGTLTYQVLGRFKTAFPVLHSLKALKKKVPVINEKLFDGGFEYSDAYLPENDSRFVLNFILKAYNEGATALNYCELKDAEFKDGLWHCVLEALEGRILNVKTKSLINSAGPQIDELNSKLDIMTQHRHVLSKGIHMIFPRIHQEEKVLAFFADDGRLFFLIPMGDKTCIGTTDTMVDRHDVEVTDEDRSFLLSNVNRLLKLSEPLRAEQTISERCGVRPLVVEKKSGDSGKEGDWFKLSRKHELEINSEKKSISLFGGKLTDCLNIGEEVLDILKKDMGFNIPSVNLDTLSEPSIKAKQKFMKEFSNMKISGFSQADVLQLAEKIWRRYSDFTHLIPEMIRSNPDLLEPLGEDVSLLKLDEEMAYRYEMALTKEDFLRRRTLGSMTHNQEDLKKIKFTYLKE